MRRWAFCFVDSNIVRSEPVFWLGTYDRSLGRLSGSAGLDSAGCCESKSAGLILAEHFSLVKHNIVRNDRSLGRLRGCKKNVTKPPKLTML